jgi:hypothetical protein
MTVVDKDTQVPLLTCVAMSISPRDVIREVSRVL